MIEQELGLLGSSLLAWCGTPEMTCKQGMQLPRRLSQHISMTTMSRPAGRCSARLSARSSLFFTCMREGSSQTGFDWPANLCESRPEIRWHASSPRPPAKGLKTACACMQRPLLGRSSTSPRAHTHTHPKSTESHRFSSPLACCHQPPPLPAGEQQQHQQ